MTENWWKNSVVYQIYPRSFKDSNGDGIGDLRGILEKLDYLQLLGVSVVWLSPVYQSPNDDNGYDISNYHEIMDEFGTLADWEELLTGLHARGIRLVMDLVVNHTSDEHAWFVEARKSSDNPYRDFYIWRKGENGREPNNWRSFFGGSAWEYDAQSGEYYLHLFTRKQPDLNWENPALRKEVFKLMRWWLDKGVDGFRMDVINLISKTPGLPSAPIAGPSPYQHAHPLFVHGPHFMEYMLEMKEQALAGYDTLTVGETPMVTVAQAREITHPQSGALNMVFQFEYMSLDNDPSQPLDSGFRQWSLGELKKITTRWQTELNGQGWNSLFLSNHDFPRQVSRFGNDREYRRPAAKLLGTFLHMLKGTPYIYQGEELGMTNVAFDSIEEYRDVMALNFYQEWQRELGMTAAEALELIRKKGRDNARTPMQWDASPHAGFSTGTPWIQANPNYAEINAAQAMADPDSVFHYYRKLIQLRKQYEILTEGDYAILIEDHPQVYAFTRIWQGEIWLVLLNFSEQLAELALPTWQIANNPRLIIANYGAGESFGQKILRPYEAQVWRIAGAES